MRLYANGRECSAQVDLLKGINGCLLPNARVGSNYGNRNLLSLWSRMFIAFSFDSISKKIN